MDAAEVLAGGAALETAEEGERVVLGDTGGDDSPASRGTTGKMDCFLA